MIVAKSLKDDSFKIIEKIIQKEFDSRKVSIMKNKLLKTINDTGWSSPLPDGYFCVFKPKGMVKDNFDKVYEEVFVNNVSNSHNPCRIL